MRKDKPFSVYVITNKINGKQYVGVTTQTVEARFKNHIDGARKIIRELMRTIDLENGNDVSKQLFRLYNRLAMKLIKANVQRNSGLIDEVIEDLTNIRWGFQKAIEIKSGVTTLEEVMQEPEMQEVAMENSPVSEEVTDENAG